MDEIIKVTIQTNENEVSVAIYHNGDSVAQTTKGEMTIEQMRDLLQQVVNVLPILIK